MIHSGQKTSGRNKTGEPTARSKGKNLHANDSIDSIISDGIDQLESQSVSRPIFQSIRQTKTQRASRVK